MTEASAVLDRQTVELLHDAHEWRLIGLLFERPRGTWLADVERLSAMCGSEDLIEASHRAHDATEGHYLSLLGPNGPVSPREAGYRRTADPAQVLAEIAAYYEAFAFHPEREDPLDHIAVLSGFVGWMRMKEAYARANADLESAEVTRAAAERFVRMHLASCAGALEEKLEAYESGHLLPAARALAARAGPLLQPIEGDWVPSGFDVGGCAFTCGRDETGDGTEDELPPEYLDPGLR